MLSTCQMVPVSHKKAVTTTSTSTACQLLAASPASPASPAITPSTVVTFRTITPDSGCGLVCKSPAAHTTRSSPTPRPTTPDPARSAPSPAPPAAPQQPPPPPSLRPQHDPPIGTPRPGRASQDLPPRPIRRRPRPAGPGNGAAGRGPANLTV